MILLLKRLGYRWHSPEALICIGDQRFVELESRFDAWCATEFKMLHSGTLEAIGRTPVDTVLAQPSPIQHFRL